MVKHLFLFLSTGMYSGLFPKAPGTMGSLVALILAILFKEFFYMSDFMFGSLCILVSIIGVPISTYASEVIYNRKDPKEVVIDEFAGLWIGLWVIPSAMEYSWLYYGLGFSLFRFFDILKPWPVSSAERAHKGLGIMLDDIVAGVITGGILYGLLYLEIWV